MLSLTAVAVPNTFAGLSIGDPKSDLGALTLSGALRVNYQDKNYVVASANDQKIKFDVGIFRLGYTANDWFGQAEYRCYQYDKLCDFSTLVSGYLGYKINTEDTLTIGLQPVPFGPGRYWDSSFYAGINNTMGLQDILNLGLNYHAAITPSTTVDLAYFLTDGGNYRGTSKDAARYTANMIHSSDPTKTNLQEENMWVARVIQDINLPGTPDVDLSFGASYWYSDIDNKKSGDTGDRKAWSLFGQLGYKGLGLTFTGGDLSIDNKDPVHMYESTFGSFDSEYDLANEGNFYTVDLKYSFKDVRDGLNITPYAVYSSYDKKEKDFHDSERHIVGVAFDYKNMSLYSEYIWSKNDPFIGGSNISLAQGVNEDWNKLLNLMFIYSF